MMMHTSFTTPYMYVNNMDMELTNKEKEILSQIVCDNETGHHLLHRRSGDYWRIRNEWVAAGKAVTPTDRQKNICEYVHQCSDYDYYNSLPLDKRMF